MNNFKSLKLIKKTAAVSIFVPVFMVLNLSASAFGREGEGSPKIKSSPYTFRERRQFRRLKEDKGIQTQIFWSGPYKSKKIALTFDDGPNPETTLLILKELEQREVLATFFLLGENAEAHPELVREIEKREHEIGNHSYSHPNMGKSQPLKVIREIRRTQMILKDITGSSPVLFRPPYGTMMLEDLVVMPRFGLKTILWTVDSRDWSGLNGKQIEEIILGAACGGSIIVCHEQCRETIKSLAGVIDVLRERGYEFVTVSEIIGEE